MSRGKDVRSDDTLPGYMSFVAVMAQGECLCADINPRDRPCLTCEAQAVQSNREHAAKEAPTP